MKKARESNIELLRILTMLGVVALHYNHADIGGAFAAVSPSSVSQVLLYITESIAIIAVNLFVLISGYFMCTSQKRNPWKIIFLILQVSVFSAGMYLLRVVLGADTFQVKSLVFSLVPANYFVLLYSAVYFISPYLNILLQKKTLTRGLLITLGLLFSVWSTIVDFASDLTGLTVTGIHTVSSQGSQYGYTIVNFTLMYLIGGYLRLSEPKNIPTGRLLAAFLANTALMTAWALAGQWIGRPLDNSAWAYSNPLVIINAILAFVLFRRIPLGEVKWINKLAEGAFTVYLLHAVFFRFLSIPKFAAMHPVVLLGHLIASCVGIYVACWCVYLVWQLVTRPIFTFLEKKFPLGLPEVPNE